MSSFKDGFSLGLQTWSLWHYPDHDYVLSALRELALTSVGLGTCHLELWTSRQSFPKRIDSYCGRLNEHTAKGLEVVYQGKTEFPPGTDLIPVIRSTSFQGDGNEGRISFAFQPVDTSELIGKYRQAGVAITSFGPCSFRGTPETEEVRHVFDFAKRAGAGVVLLHTVNDEHIPLLESLSEQYGVKLAMHNHGRNHPFGRIEDLEALFAKSSPSIGFCLDTAWAVDAGEDPVLMAREFGDRLYEVHCKELTYDNDGNRRAVPVGAGTFDLEGLMRFLDGIAYEGIVSLEYEGFERDSIPALKQSRDYLIECLNAIPSHTKQGD